MSLFKNFGKKQPKESQQPKQAAAPAAPVATPPAEQAPAPAQAAAPEQAPEMIRIVDEHGRASVIPKSEWRTNILPGHLAQVRNHPDALYGSIVQALREGAIEEVIESAEHLSTTDTIPERGTVLLANIYRERKRPEQSEQVLRRHIDKHGETGAVLITLAQAQAAQGTQPQFMDTLWRGIQLDPNQGIGVGWYEAIHREKEGVDAGIAAMRRIAALPGSWCARLWLARAALQNKDLKTALDLYREALDIAGTPKPTELLQQMTSDLGVAGHLAELLELATPHFEVATHGLVVGNNLIKAYVDLGHLPQARELVERHHKLHQPAWRSHLTGWEQQIARAQAAAFVAGAAPELTVANTPGPMWLPEQSPFNDLFPALAANAPTVAFLGSTAQVPAEGSQERNQYGDVPPRISRALPLFLAEQAQFGAGARVQTLVPWLTSPHCGFAMLDTAWSTEEAVQAVRQQAVQAEYIVITHLVAESAPWKIELRLLRTSDGATLATVPVAFAPQEPVAALLRLAQDLVRLLGQHASAKPTAPANGYQLPQGGDLLRHLIHLEQLLAARCAMMENANDGFLVGVRDIIEDNLQFAYANPQNPTVRMVLMELMVALRGVRPSIVDEYREPLQRLIAEQPLPGNAQTMCLYLMANFIAPAPQA